MTDGVEIRLGADTSQATSGISSAASAIEANFAALRSALTGFAAKSAETSAAVVGHTKAISNSVAGMSENVRVRLGSVNSAFVQLRSSFLAFGAVFAGGALFKDSVEAMLSEEQAVRSLEISFGMTAEAATRLHVALSLAGVSTERYTSMAMRVQMMLKTQPQLFDRVGVKVRDASGAYLSAAQILQNVYARMQDFKAGTDQNMVALATVGRSAAGFADDMSRVNAVTERATELQQQFGIEMGDAEQGKIERYRIELNAFRLAIDQIGVKIGEAVMPALESMAAYFNSVGPAAAKFIVNAIKTVIAVVDNFASSVKEGVVLASGYWDALKDRAAELMHALKLLFSDGWSAMRSYVETENKRILANVLKTNQEALGIEADYQKRMAALWSDKEAPGGGAPPRPKSGSLSAPDLRLGRGGGGKGATDILAQWKDQLEQMQEAEGYFHEMSKAQEAAFWQAKLALVRGNGQEEVKLRRDINRMIFADSKSAAQEEYRNAMAAFQREIDAARNNKDEQIKDAEARTAFVKATFGEESAAFQRALDEETRIRQAWAKKEEELVLDAGRFKGAMAVAEIAGERQQLDQAVALRKVSAQQKYAIEEQFENRLYQLKLQELQETLATLQQGTLAYQRTAEQIEALEVAHQQRLTQIQNQAELERKQYALQAVQDTQSAFANFFASFADGTKTMKQRFQDLVNSIEQSLARIAANQVAKQLFGAGTTGGNFLQSMFGGIFGGGSGSGGADLAGSATALTSSAGLLSAAGAALQTAAATMSMGGMGGSMFSGGMFGAGGGLFGGMGSFFGFPGFAVGTPYVPQDMLAVIHRGEAIVPASMNKAGAMTGGGMSVSQHFHLSGQMDARSQGQLAAAAYRGVIGAQRRHV